MPSLSFRLLLLSSLLLSGCELFGTEEEEEGGPGRFEATVSGAFDHALTGQALFAVTLHDGQPVFTLQFQSDTDAPFILLSAERPVTATPQAGTYAVVGSLAEAGASAFAVTYTRSQQNPFLFDPFTATGGTLEITTSTPNRLRGVFSFDARADGARTIRVEGTFDAIAGH